MDIVSDKERGEEAVYARNHEAAFAHLVHEIGPDAAVALSKNVGYDHLTTALFEQRKMLESKGTISADNLYPKGVLNLSVFEKKEEIAPKEPQKPTETKFTYAGKLEELKRIRS